MAGTKLYYETTGTWSAISDINDGDPLGAGNGSSFGLSGYALTSVTYENLDTTHHILSMGAGHKALLLDDTITGAQGAQGRIVGIDVINGNSGGQIIDLTSKTILYGNVTINGGRDADVLMANAGNDSIKGGGGNDYLWGGSGNDSMTGGYGNDRLLGATGNDQLSGGEGNDSLNGGNGNDLMSGGKGNDLVLAGLGNQTMQGNSGLDILDFFNVRGHATIDVGKHLATVEAAGETYHSRFSTFEKIYGTEQGTDFIGSATTRMILLGGAGNDHFHSNGAGDLLTGKGGADVYEWNKKSEAGSTHADIIKDFVVGTDKLDLHDFLKGQAGMKAPAYNDVVHVVTSADGVLVQALVGGAFHDIVNLVGVQTHDLDLLLA
jgi:Ca2+-binding RTX toxin-like protein